MARPLPSIKLHADARDYYRAAGLLPRAPAVERRVGRTVAWAAAALLFALLVWTTSRTRRIGREGYRLAALVADVSFGASTSDVLKGLDSLDLLRREVERAAAGRPGASGRVTSIWADRLHTSIDRRLSDGDHALKRLHMTEATGTTDRETAGRRSATAEAAADGNELQAPDDSPASGQGASQGRE